MTYEISSRLSTQLYWRHIGRTSKKIRRVECTGKQKLKKEVAKSCNLGDFFGREKTDTTREQRDVWCRERSEKGTTGIGTARLHIQQVITDIGQGFAAQTKRLRIDTKGGQRRSITSTHHSFRHSLTHLFTSTSRSFFATLGISFTIEFQRS